MLIMSTVVIQFHNLASLRLQVATVRNAFPKVTFDEEAIKKAECEALVLELAPIPPVRAGGLSLETTSPR